MSNKQNHNYILGLDGLRAFAIFFIVAYHLSIGWASGGFLGVNAFFVLSGYLMTSKILSMHKNKHGFQLKQCWGGRVRRLMPTVYTMIIATVLWIVIFNQDILSKIWGDIISSAFCATNWWFIFHKLSYFDSFGTPAPLKHLWFLGVQEQFFFIWSAVLALWLKYFKKPNGLAGVIFMGILCSALLMAMMYSPGADPSRIYYGTDTRAFELLIGSWLAIALPMNKLLASRTSNNKRMMLNIAAAITFAVFILGAIFVDEYVTFLYTGGMLLFDLNMVVLLICICHPSCFIGNMLSWKPLRWIGTRAFGIYLWHYPIIVLSTPIYEIGNLSYWRVALQILTTCVLSELSYRFIEMPIRQRGLRKFIGHSVSASMFKIKQLTLVKKAAIIAMASILMVFVMEGSSILRSKIDVTDSAKGGHGVSYADAGPSSFASSALSSDEINEVRDMKMFLRKSDKQKAGFPIENERYEEILVIGDSIMVDIGPYIKKRYTNITVDGKVSRQMSDAIKLVPHYVHFNDSNKAVVIELGTNGYFTEQQLDTLLNSFSKADIYLVNTRVPRSWEKKVNKILMETAEERENVGLIDWYSTALRNPEYFGHDGVHLKPSGSKALTKLICDAIE